MIHLELAIEKVLRGSNNPEIREAQIEDYLRAVLAHSFSSFGVQTPQVIECVVRTGLKLDLAFLPGCLAFFAINQLGLTKGLSFKSAGHWLGQCVQRWSVGGGWRSCHVQVGSNTCFCIETRSSAEQTAKVRAYSEEYLRRSGYELSDADDFRRKIEDCLSLSELPLFQYLTGLDTTTLVGIDDIVLASDSSRRVEAEWFSPN